VLQLRANAEAQAFALQGVERESALGEEVLRAKEEVLQRKRAMGEELLHAKAQVAELRAEISIRGAALEAKEAALCSKDTVFEAKDALIRGLQSESQRRDDGPAAGDASQQSSARASCISAAAIAPTPAPAPACPIPPPPHLLLPPPPPPPAAVLCHCAAGRKHGAHSCISHQQLVVVNALSRGGHGNPFDLRSSRSF
jgi:hypothetical protein